MFKVTFAELKLSPFLFEKILTYVREVFGKNRF